MDDVKKKMNRVAASLEHGRILSKKWITFLHAIIFLALILIAGIIAIGITENVMALFALIFPVLIITIFVFLIVKDFLLKKKLKMCLYDAVELNATTSKVGTYRYYMGGTMYKIRVKFNFNGKTITRNSGKQCVESNSYSTKAGYDEVFKKFVDRQIKILYSIKYDQVLILND